MHLLIHTCACMLWSPHGGSKYLIHHNRENYNCSSLPFKPTSDSGIASWNVHHLLLSRQNLLSELFLTPGKIPASSPVAPLTVKSSFSTENQEEPNRIVSLQSSRSLITTAIPAHLLWQPSTCGYSFGSQHTKKSFHCSTALCVTTSQDSLTGFQLHFQLLKALPQKSALHLMGQM